MPGYCRKLNKSLYWNKGETYPQDLERRIRVKKRALWVLIVLLALLASACTFKFSTTVNEDATGKFVTEFGLTADEITQLEAFGGESFDSMCTVDEFATGSSENVVVEQEQRGDETWCVATLSFNSLSELEAAYGDMDVQINTLTLTEDEFVYDVSFNVGADPEMDLGALAAMGVDLSLVWEVTAPGRVTDHNGDEINGQVVTWNLDPTAATSLQVRSQVGGGGFNIALVIGLVVAVVVIVAVVIFLLSRRKPAMPQEPQPPVA